MLELILKSEIFKTKLEEYKKLGIVSVIIEEPLLNSNNVYTIQILLRFNIFVYIKMLLTKPSFYSLAFTGILILAIFIIIICNIKRFCHLSTECLIKVLSLVGVLIGVHGLQHLGLSHL